MKAISAVQSHHHFLHPKTTPFLPQSHSQQLLLSVKSHFPSNHPPRRTLVLTHIKTPREDSDVHWEQKPSRSKALLTRSAAAAAAAAGASIGLVVFWMFVDEHSSKAMALGPGGGPFMEEEFWDNVRRYALYALTVSTGALYTILVPIVELLKNPISAVLVLVILVGGFYIVSQVVSAMVGLSDFSYSYAY